MADLDPSIILAGGSINDPGRMLSLAKLAQEVQAAQRQTQAQNALKQMFAQQGSLDAQGNPTPQTIQKVMQIDPATGMELRQQTVEQQVKEAQAAHYKTQAGRDRFDFLSGTAGVGTDAYEAAKASGRSEQEARAIGQSARNDAIKNNGGALSEQDASAALATPFDPAQAKVFAMANPDYAGRVEKERSEARMEEDERRKEALAGADIGLKRAELGLKAEEIALDRRKLETGFGIDRKLGSPGEIEYTDPSGKVQRADAVYDPNAGRYLSAEGLKPIEGSDFRPLKGGEAGLGNRAEVYLQRVMTGANEAVRAAQNMMELPISTSRGIFGGRTQGGSLFDAAKESLTNEMTTQEVQDYNTMVAGVQRNLSTIEAGGLAPPGSLTHSMDAIVLKEGDSYLTKARKMAEMRQIVEAGLQPNLANPKIPVEQKDFIKKTINDMATAIPFTQHDITMFERQGRPTETISDYSKRVEPSAGTAPKGVDPDLWEHMTPDERALWK